MMPSPPTTPAPMNRRPRQAIDTQHLLYRNIPAILYVLSEEGKVIDVSDQCLATLGYARQEVIGRDSLDFLTPASRTRLESIYLQQLRQQGEIKDVACEFVKKHGESVPMLLSATAECNEAGEMVRVFSLLMEVKQRNEAERLLKEVVEGTVAVTGNEFFYALVSHLARAFGVMYCMVTECKNRSLTRLRTLATYKYGQFLEHFEYDPTGGPCDGVIKNGVCLYPRLKERFPREDQASYLGVAIYDSQHNVIGHLVIEDDKPMYPSPYAVDILRLCAARAGAELERKWAEEALQERERQLSVLNDWLLGSNSNLEQLIAERTHEIERRSRVAENLRELMTLLNSERPLDEMLQYIVVTATDLLEASAGSVYGLQADKETLILRASHALPNEYSDNLIFHLHQSLIGQAILKRTPLVITDIAHSFYELGLTFEQARRDILISHYKTLLLVPLFRQPMQGSPEELYGGISLYYADQREFSDDAIALAIAFASQAALSIENANLRQRVQTAAIIEERNRLSRELHDSVTQQLYSLNLLTESWRRAAHNGQLNNAEEALTELGQISQQALKEMRLLLSEMRPVSVETEGLAGALTQRLASVEKRSGIETRLSIDESIKLTPTIEAGLYRIAVEALNNSIKHAHASKVQIALRNDYPQICFKITDNGSGFDTSQTGNGGGFGLISMRERAAQLGGRLLLHSAPGEGTTVQVLLPI